MAPNLLNFLNYDEKVDPNSRLTETAARTTATGLPRNEDAFILFDVQSLIAGVDFDHEFFWNQDISSTGTANEVIVAADKHTVGRGPFWEFANNSSEFYGLEATKQVGNLFRIFLDEFGGGILRGRDFLDLSSGTHRYWYRWRKVGTAMSLDAWTDDTKVTPISGFPLSVTVDVSTARRWFFPNSSGNDGVAGTAWNGHVEDMTVDFGGGGVKNVLDMGRRAGRGMSRGFR